MYNKQHDGMDWARRSVVAVRVPDTKVEVPEVDIDTELVKDEWAVYLKETAISDDRTPGQRLAAMYGDCREAVVDAARRTSEKRKKDADAYSKYLDSSAGQSWRSHDKIGNTQIEIAEIRATGAPFSEVEVEPGGFAYRAHEGYTDGFLKSTQEMKDRGWYLEEARDGVSIDPFEDVYDLPVEEQDKVFTDLECAEVVHKVHGRGYIVDSTDDGVRVFFMTLPVSTPSIRRGANIKWVKRENLL